MLIRDEEGDALPDLAAARALVLETLREMERLPQAYGAPRAWRRDVFVITDEAGAVLAEIPCDTLL